MPSNDPSKFSPDTKYAYLAHKLDQLKILTMYLSIDFKPEACDDYVDYLIELFKMSHRDICWRAWTDRSFDCKPYMLEDNKNTK